jgi:hypothetical protein
MLWRNKAQKLFFVKVHVNNFYHRALRALERVATVYVYFISVCSEGSVVKINYNGVWRNIRFCQKFGTSQMAHDKKILII